VEQDQWMHMDCLASFLGFHVVREAIVFSPLQAGMFQPPTKVTKKLVHMSNQKHGNVCEYVVDVVVSFGLQCFDAVGWAAGRASGL